MPEEPDMPVLKREQKAFLLKYVNPYRMVYLWGAIETLDLKALNECIQALE